MQVFKRWYPQCENFGCKMAEGHHSKTVNFRILVWTFVWHFSTVLRKNGKGGGVKAPLGPPNYAPLRVYEISGITKSTGLQLVRTVVGFLLCTYSKCFCAQ